MVFFPFTGKIISHQNQAGSYRFLASCRLQSLMKGNQGRDPSRNPGAQTMEESGFFACFLAQGQLPGTTWLDKVRFRAGWPHLHQLVRNKKSPRYAHKPICLATIAAEVSSQVGQLTTNINCDSHQKKKKERNNNAPNQLLFLRF